MDITKTSITSMGNRSLALYEPPYQRVTNETINSTCTPLSSSIRQGLFLKPANYCVVSATPQRRGSGGIGREEGKAENSIAQSEFARTKSGGHQRKAADQQQQDCCQLNGAHFPCCFPRDGTTVVCPALRVRQRGPAVWQRWFSHVIEDPSAVAG